MKINYLSFIIKSGVAIFSIILLACNYESVHDASIYAELQDYQAETFVYECDDYSFTARIEGQQAWLFLPGKTINLPHVVSASGAKYSDGETVFWNKGKEALLILGINSLDSMKQRNCINNRKKAIWEHAKLNGVDFRAIGNEPGWHLEISQGRQIVLVTDYGENRFIFSTPEPETDSQARQTSYKASQDGNQLLITIEGRSCHDTMSGDGYASRVKVTINKKSYQGCGAALH